MVCPFQNFILAELSINCFDHKITLNSLTSCSNSLYLVCDVGVCYDRMQLHTFNHISQKFSNIVLARNDFCFKANCAFTYYDHITEIE